MAKRKLKVGGRGSGKAYALTMATASTPRVLNPFFPLGYSKGRGCVEYSKAIREMVSSDATLTEYNRTQLYTPVAHPVEGQLHHQGDYEFGFKCVGCGKISGFRVDRTEYARGTHNNVQSYITCFDWKIICEFCHVEVTMKVAMRRLNRFYPTTDSFPIPEDIPDFKLITNVNFRGDWMKKMELEDKIIDYLNNQAGKKSTLIGLSKSLKMTEKEIFPVLDDMRKNDIVVKSKNDWILIPLPDKYIDWNGNLKKMEKLRELEIPTLCIGEKGTGKTMCIVRLAEKGEIDLHTVNLSLRTRESHILGRLDIQEKNGIQSVTWMKGPLPLSMESGGIFYADELSAGEPDVLLKLDEALDDRRQLSHEGQVVKAKEGWWCVSSINPLTTPGTKELPPQLISRFTARLNFKYPDQKTELKIVKAHTKFNGHRDEMMKIIGLFSTMRATKELPYTPSLRETIAFARMLKAGVEFEECVETIALNPLLHWDEVNYEVAHQLANSMGLV